MSGKTCPCGSQQLLEKCCLPFLTQRAIAASAEQLMRSRFTAYALRYTDYLVDTWHTTTRPPDLAQLLNHDNSATDWLSLRIISKMDSQRPNESFVTFFARYHAEQQLGWIYETSRFVCENNRWYYIDGVHKIPGRNELCPCGSEKKFKKCCTA